MYSFSYILLPKTPKPHPKILIFKNGQRAGPSHDANLKAASS